MMLDRCIVEFDRVLRTLALPARSQRPQPGRDLPDNLPEAQRAGVVGLMRVNHVGEVCAQALYQGQAWTSEKPETRQALQAAADEEVEHLAWTQARIDELGGRVSLLNPLWYAGALSIGVLAGLAGERWNLGFLAETERQVEAHLDGHLERLPTEDLRSRAIVAQMRADEIRHAEMAMGLGAAELPPPIKLAMRACAGIMTRIAYFV